MSSEPQVISPRRQPPSRFRHLPHLAFFVSAAPPAPAFVRRQRKEKASRKTMTVIAHGCANWNSGVLVREIG